MTERGDGARWDGKGIAVDAIVVLGCRVLGSGELSTSARARTARAIRAFHDGVAPLVVASGGRRWGPHAEAWRIREALVAGGVPREAVLPELASLSTFENAVFSAAALARVGARRVALVTCSWHMARAVASFEAMGLDVVALASDGAPVPLRTRLVRAVHESLSGRLDAARCARSALLRDLARGFWSRSPEPQRAPLPVDALPPGQP